MGIQIFILVLLTHILFKKKMKLVSTLAIAGLAFVAAVSAKPNAGTGDSASSTEATAVSSTAKSESTAAATNETSSDAAARETTTASSSSTLSASVLNFGYGLGYIGNMV